MAQVQVQQASAAQTIAAKLIPGHLNPRSRLELDTKVPVSQNGSFAADRVLKSGYVQKRTQKTKVGSSKQRQNPLNSC